MKKMGIAPIVATLLLISFAVAVGVVVMTFGRAQVQLEAECPINIGLKFSQVSGQDQICYDTTTNELFFIVENGANVKVSGLTVNLIGNEAVQTFQVDESIDKAGTFLKRLVFPGGVRQAKIIPKINLQDEQHICNKKALIVENLRVC